MIRSVIGNILVVILGLGLVSLPIVGAIVDGGVSIGSFFSALLGAWCLLGGLSNLRGRAHAPRDLRSYRFARWNLVLFGAFFIALIVGTTGLAKARNSAPFELALHVAALGLVGSFLVACGVLLYHRVAKAV